MLKLLLIPLLLASAFTRAHDTSTPALSMADCMKMLSGDGTRAGQPTPSQRQMVTALEVQKLKPPTPDNVHFIDATASLRELSQINLEALKHRLGYPELKKINRGRLEKIQAMAQSLKSIAVIKRNSEVDGPVTPTPDFYSNLVGGSKTVGLKLIVTPEPHRLHTLAGQISSDHNRANADFIRDFAFVLPNFSSAKSLIKFFEMWDPAALSEVIQVNRYNLPVNVRTAEQFQHYISSHSAIVFPETALYPRLAPLRERLHQYLLTPEDAEKFVRHAVELYMVLSVEQGLKPFGKLEELFNSPGGPGYFYSEAMKLVGWTEGVAVKAPLNLPHYLILRRSEVLPLAHSRVRSPMDSRRLDHKGQP